MLDLPMMSSPYVSIDMDRLAAPTFDDEDPVSDAHLSDIFRGGDYESVVTPLLDHIPPHEADAIHMFVHLRKRQVDVAEIFGITQSAVAQRIAQGIRRIRFLLSMPKVTEAEMFCDLAPLFDPADLRILARMAETSCQSETARRLGIRQRRVAHRLERALKVLKAATQKDPTFTRYHELFRMIAENPNILRSLRQAKWTSRRIVRR